jgi:Tol biopolymer transport system component
LTGDNYEAAAPAVSADGHYVVFISRRATDLNIWGIDMNGTNLKQLTHGGFDNTPYCSPDGKWLVYTSSDPPVGHQHLVKMPIEGGDPVSLTNTSSRGGIVSPDGKLIACWYWSHPASATQIAVIPFEGGEPLKVFDLPPSAFPSLPPPSYLRWTSDSRAVLYIDTRGNVSNIWSQSLDGGPPKQVTDFKSDRIFSFDWSRDGKQLALARGTQTSDVVLISNFK